MKSHRMRRTGIAVLLLFAIIFTQAGCSSRTKDGKIPVRVLILPKFEQGELVGDFPGEAQYFYEEYLAGGDAYDIEGAPEAGRLYYRDGVAMFLLGQGKVNAALSTAAVLSDDRFDFSEAYVLCVGCGGAARGYGIFGDVYVISAAVDFDLGYRADPREMGSGAETTWFHDESLDGSAVIRLDEGLTDRVFELVKDVPLETTPRTEAFLEREFPGEAWAQRRPRVMRGTAVTGDTYWKGVHDHANALLITETYGCADPFAVTEMEDLAAARAAESFGLLGRLIILRTAVNMDVFPAGVTPEMLWDPDTDDHVASEEGLESVDIFETAMRNCFAAGRVLIDAVLAGDL